jgi:hypothetical protein
MKDTANTVHAIQALVEDTLGRAITRTMWSDLIRDIEALPDVSNSKVTWQRWYEGPMKNKGPEIVIEYSLVTGDSGTLRFGTATLAEMAFQ